MRRSGFLAVAVLLAVPLVGCNKTDSTATGDSSTTSTTAATSTTAGGAPKNAGASVLIEDGFKYEPADITVKVNEALTWTNQAAAKHTVTATDGQPITFKSPTLSQGDTFVQTFNTPGTYTYFCSIHGESKMKGTITVTP